MVGPLPIINGNTTYSPLNYIYNKGQGYQRVYDIDEDALDEFMGEVGASVAYITLDLFNGVSLKSPIFETAVANA